MHISTDDLSKQLDQHITALEQLKLQSIEIHGAIKCIQRIIAKAHATKEGQQPEGDLSEHQDGESSGQAPESRNSDSTDQSPQQQEG